MAFATSKPGSPAQARVMDAVVRMLLRRDQTDTHTEELSLYESHQIAAMLGQELGVDIAEVPGYIPNQSPADPEPAS